MWQVAVLLLLVVPCWTLTLQETLQRSYQEQSFETILLLQHKKQLACHQMEQVMEAATWPALRFNNEANFYLRHSQSSEMLALICLTGHKEMDTEMWQALAKNLYNMRHVRLLLLQQQQQEEEEFVEQLFEELRVMTEELQFPHVLLLFVASGNAFRLQPYADRSWLTIDNITSIFVKLQNYQRHVARTLPDQISASSMAFIDKKTGQLRLAGFVSRLIQEFTRNHNITLQLQREVVIGEELSIILLRNMSLNGTLNLPITLCGYELASEVGIFSYPYDMTSWSIMVPCAREIPTADVYVLVFNWRMLTLLLMSYALFVLLDFCLTSLLMRKNFDWTNLMCNERMISGILGQPSSLWPHYTISSRMTQAQLFIVGLMISTVFAAHLKTLLTKRPTERKISNFQELRDSKLRIYFEEGERFYVNKIAKGSPIDMIRFKIEYLQANNYFSQRRKLNTSQAFSTTSAGWMMTNRQQQKFHRPAYCYHPDLVINLNLLMSVPLQANSIYAEPLDLFIHQVHSSGLLNYWQEEALRALTALGRINQKDPYDYEPFHEFKLPDLYWVWLNLFLGFLLGLIAFICELSVHGLKINA